MKQRGGPDAQPVGHDLVYIQVHIADRLIVYAEALDHLQPPEVLLVDQAALLVILLDQGLELLLPRQLLVHQTGLFRHDPVALLGGVPQEHIEDVPHLLQVEKMAVVLDPPDRAVLPAYPVLHIVQVVLAGGYLRPNALLHLLQVLRVHHAPEGVAGEGPEFLHRPALKHPQQGLVGIDDFLSLVRVVD